MTPAAQPGTTRLAPAKINLTLHVTGQRPDGYHLLDSLVVFADIGDLLTLRPAPGVSLRVTGRFAADLGAGPENLVNRAARLMHADNAAMSLEKRLPVASGMGGGSADAAAALHLLARATGQPLPDPARAMALGADLPVCLAAPAPSRMRGLGERVDKVAGVPPLWLLLVNPGQGLATPVVFNALENKTNPAMPARLPGWQDAAGLCAWLAIQRNDLEAPARRLASVISDLLAELSAQPGCLLARMTGSGATCFGIFADQSDLNRAERALAAPGRFVAATRSTGSLR